MSEHWNKYRVNPSSLFPELPRLAQLWTACPWYGAIQLHHVSTSRRHWGYIQWRISGKRPPWKMAVRVEAIDIKNIRWRIPGQRPPAPLCANRPHRLLGAQAYIQSRINQSRLKLNSQLSKSDTNVWLPIFFWPFSFPPYPHRCGIRSIRRCQSERLWRRCSLFWIKSSFWTTNYFGLILIPLN